MAKTTAKENMPPAAVIDNVTILHAIQELTREVQDLKEQIRILKMNVSQHFLNRR